MTLHTLPKLSYELDALEPHIDARTMKVHHEKHHASYIDKLNAALAGHPDLVDRDVRWLLCNTARLPRSIRTVVRRNAGGHLNHSMFWKAVSPSAGGLVPGALASAIARDFGSLEKFQSRFVRAGVELFGSGWVWLAREHGEGGKLKIYTTYGHDNPVMRGHHPLLLNDVWEHAYYLKYENRREDYLENWWPIVNWAEAVARFAETEKAAECDWEDEGGQIK